MSKDDKTLPPVDHVAVSEPDTKAAFNHGYLLACCNLVNLHDEPGMAFDILSELGLSKADVKAMDLGGYDRKALREIERGRGGKTIYRAAATEADHG